MVNAMRVLTLLATLAVCAVVNVYGSEYCSIKCRSGKTHTLCQYNIFDPPARECGSVYSPTPREKENDKAEILKFHNEHRAFVASGRETRGGGQPRAKNLRDLEWDDELSKIAQAWANQCAFAHDKCRDTSKFGYVGQNIATASTTGPNYRGVEATMSGWYNEVDYFYGKQRVRAFRPDPPGTPYERVTGHYSQLVWAKTTHVGCGVIRYATVEDGTEWKNTFVVCNYGPGGNVVGQPVYEIA